MGFPLSDIGFWLIAGDGGHAIAVSVLEVAVHGVSGIAQAENALNGGLGIESPLFCAQS